MKQLFITAVLGLTAVVATAELPLEIYSGRRDTVTTSEQAIVAVTVPGAKASINGQEVKVYPFTGSFGAKVALVPGANHICITAEKDGETARCDFDIFRAEAVTAKTAARTDPFARERTTVFDNPIYIKTRPGAYLQYGNGDDRLGGSKMGFIDENICLKVDGEHGSLYRVALAQGRFAYIAKEHTEPASSVAPIVNTLSWSVDNVGRTDRVIVGLPVRLAYQYTTQLDPSTICIDIFGATDNSNWITQRTLDLGMIDHVDFEQPQSDVYRVRIHLKDRYQWGFSVRYEGTNLVIDVRHRPQADGFKGLVVGLDAGHGGKDSGAFSPSGIREKDINLDIVLKLADMLRRARATVVFTRDDDTALTMVERKRILREAAVDIAVSIHNNSGCSPFSAPGTAALYKHVFDRPLAASICRRLLELDVPLFGLVGNFNFSLNGPTDYPNMLVEGLFMSSLEEESMLADPDFRTKMANKIYLGLEDYLKETKIASKKR